MTVGAARPAEQSHGFWSYEEWTARLALHFFRPEYASEHVLFYVDAAELAEIRGSDEGSAVKSLVDAVRTRLRHDEPRRLFASIGAQSRRWRSGAVEGAPPALPLLAVAVLAATRMGRAVDRAGHNYYEPLAELLELHVTRDDLVASYRDEVRYLWKHIQWWLDEHERGRRGLSTIISDGHFAHIGPADSQTLFAASDRDKLSRFFSWAGLRPGQELAADELLVYFKAWALGRDDLSLGTRVMLEGETYPAQLAQIVKRAADRWEGVSRDDEGRTTFPVLLALTAFPPPAELRLVARRPPGAPRALACRFRYSTLELTDQGAEDDEGGGWYEVPLELRADFLLSGVQLRADSFSASLPPTQIHVLHKSQGLGCWASARQLVPGEPAWVLVTERIAPRVEALLNDHAQSFSPVQARGLVPAGWRLYRDVVVASPPSEPPEGLGRLIPRHENRLSLRGGLPLRASGTYLSGGEPDLWLPPAPAEGLSLTAKVDGREIRRRGGEEKVSLARQGLDPGEHEVRLGPIRRRFHSLRTLGRVDPPVEAPIGHELRPSEAGTRPVGGGPHAREAASVPSVFVSGALIDNAAGLVRGEAEAPLILPVGARRRVILGARPGEIDEPMPPAPASWMRDLGLQQQSFEYEPPFEPVWILTEWRLGRSQRARLRHGRGPTSEPLDDPAAIAAWSEALLAFEPPTEPHLAELWHAYSAVAEEAIA